MSDSTMAGVQASASPQTLGVELGVAMLKKSQDVMEAQAQSMLKLVESVPEAAPQGSVGHNINVTA